jgi:hypothetical protein
MMNDIISDTAFVDCLCLARKQAKEAREALHKAQIESAKADAVEAAFEEIWQRHEARNAERRNQRQ